jgi:hypothetical protein
MILIFDLETGGNWSDNVVFSFLMLLIAKWQENKIEKRPCAMYRKTRSKQDHVLRTGKQDRNETMCYVQENKTETRPCAMYRKTRPKRDHVLRTGKQDRNETMCYLQENKTETRPCAMYRKTYVAMVGYLSELITNVII